jgi:uncharacterized protein (TIGR03000 family)
MPHRSFLSRAMALSLPVCLLAVAGPAKAQVGVGIGVYSGPGAYGPYTAAPIYPYIGWPGFRGGYGSYWTNGLSLYGPPVPVPGSIPGVLINNNDLVNQWWTRPTLGGGVGYYGWPGPINPRYRGGRLLPSPVMIEELPPLAPTQAAPGPVGCVFLSVKVPHPQAEVWVDGLKMKLTGSDRLFATPPVPADQDSRFEVTARWSERGATLESKRAATGRAGEVVRVDFTAPNLIPGGR